MSRLPSPGPVARAQIAERQAIASRLGQLNPSQAWLVLCRVLTELVGADSMRAAIDAAERSAED